PTLEDHREEVAAAFDSLFPLTSCTDTQTFGREVVARVLSTTEVQIEEQTDAPGYSTRGTLRSPEFNLVFSIQQPLLGTQLHAYPPSSSDILLDINTLVWPLPVQPHVLASMKASRPTDVSTLDEGRVSLRYANSTGYQTRVETDDGGTPLAAALYHASL